jgi:hypothetical protein
MRSLVYIIIGLFAGGALATEVYRWTDEQGQVHFSDRPKEGADRIEIRDAQTFQAPEVQPRTSSSQRVEPEAPFRYRSLEIVQPTQEEVLWNIEGQLDVSMRLEPRLQTGHNLELFLDGQPVENLRPGSTQAKLTDVFRGVHVLTASVRDQNGEVLIESQPRTFAVQQTSIQNPARPRAGG